MKFKYNDKTYVVFATETEILDEDLIVKIEEDYLDYSSYSRALVKLNTTQVLRHVTTNHKVLQAYQVEYTKKKVHAVKTSLILKGTREEIINLLDYYAITNNTVVEISHNSIYTNIYKLEEETEEQVKARVSCNNWDSVKYFKL